MIIAIASLMVLDTVAAETTSTVGRTEQMLVQHHKSHALKKVQKKVKLKSGTRSPIIPEDTIVVDDDVVLGRNRRSQQFGKLVKHTEIELSPRILARLFLARIRALQQYEQVRG